MNYIAASMESKRAEHEPSRLSLDDAHLLRSKIVDKCAAVERQVVRLLQARGASECMTTPLSQKVEKLKQALPPGTASREANRIRKHLQALEPLSKLRSELVHSTMSIGSAEDEEVVVLWSAAEPHRASGCRTLLKYEALQEIHKKLSDIANSLDQVGNGSL